MNREEIAIIHLNKAMVFDSTKQFEEAIFEYKEVLTVFPGYASAHLRISQAYFNIAKLLILKKPCSIVTRRLTMVRLCHRNT